MFPMSRFFSALLLCSILPTLTFAESKLVRKTYAVSDLVVDAIEEGKSTSDVGSMTLAVSVQQQAWIAPEDLVKLIRSTIEPSSWKKNGISIHFFPLTSSLVVSHTVDVQEQIADMLDELRRVRDNRREIQLSIRFVEVSDKVYKTLIQKLLSKKDKKEKAVILTRDETEKLFTDAQKDEGSSVLQTPRVTLVENQQINMAQFDRKKYVTGVKLLQRENLLIEPILEEIKTGFQFTLCPKKLDEGVRIQARCTQVDLANPKVPLVPISLPIKQDNGKEKTFRQYVQHVALKKTKVDQTVTVPNGSSAVISDTEVNKAVVKRASTPVLDQLPLIGARFTSQKRESAVYHRLMIVTPVVLEEEEEELR